MLSVNKLSKLNSDLCSDSNDLNKFQNNFLEQNNF